VTPVADALEVRDSIIPTRYSLTVDNAGAWAQLGERLDNERE
jgi:hypothetical protein